MNILSITPAKSDQQMNAPYDSAVLREFAGGLLSRASSIVIWCGASYGLLALAIGFSFGILAGREMFRDIPNFDVTSTALVIGAIFAVIGTFIGIVKGRDKSFYLKLEAQKILLQMQIEENTRRVIAGSTLVPPGSSS